MAGSETLSLYQQAERLQGWRDGFQAVYVIATGVQSGLRWSMFHLGRSDRRVRWRWVRFRTPPGPNALPRYA